MAVTMRIAVTISGSARTASTNRLTTSSKRPRKVAAEEPDRGAEHRPDQRRRGAITRMSREPARTRERTSRPFVSVPNGWAQVGGWLSGNWLSKIGSYGVTRFVKIAQKTQKATTIAPITTVGERRSSRRRSERRSGLAAQGRAPRARGSGRRGSSLFGPEADPRVEDGVEDVGDQRHDDVQRADDEDPDVSSGRSFGGRTRGSARRSPA